MMIRLPHIIGSFLWSHRRILFALVVVLGLLQGYYITLVINKDFYRDLIIQQFETSTGMKLHYSAASLQFLPRPALKVDNVTILLDQDESGKESLPVQLDRITIRFSFFRILYREVVFHSIQVDGAKLVLLYYPGSGLFFPGDAPDQTSAKRRGEDQRSPPSSPLSENLSHGFSREQNGSRSPWFLFRVDHLSIINLRLTIVEPDSNLAHNYWIKKLQVGGESEFGGIHGSLNGIANDKPLQASFELSPFSPDLSYQNLRLRSNIQLHEFPVSVFHHFFRTEVYRVDFRRTLLSGNFRIEKDPHKPITVHVDGDVQGLAFLGAPPFGQIFGKGSISYTRNNRRLDFRNLDLQWKGHADLQGEGHVILEGANYAEFQITGSQGRFDSALNMIQLFQTRHDPTEPPGTYIIRIDIHGVRAFRHPLDRARGTMVIHDGRMTIPDLSLMVYGGRVNASGTVDFHRNYDLMKMDGMVSGVETEPILDVYNNQKYIRGKLYGTFSFETKYKNQNDFFPGMTASADAEVRNGRLLGYANILTPLARIGKLLNILGPTGQSTDFVYLRSPIEIRNNTVYVPDLTMKGVGLDARGEGKVTFNKQIKMQLLIRIGGNLVGQALKVPVLYSGTINEDSPYVDPIWVASVITGGSIASPALGGPVGGGLAGSVASEYIRNAWDGFLSIFESEKEEEKK